MITKLEINGIKIESDEGVEKVFSMLKNIKDFNLENVGKNIEKNPKNDGECYELKDTIHKKDKLIISLQQSISELNATIKTLKEEKEKYALDHDKISKDYQALEKENAMLKNDISSLECNVKSLMEENYNLKNNNSVDSIKEQPKAVEMVKEKKIEVKTDESKQELEPTGNVDFNPNNEKDIAWLKDTLKEKEPLEKKDVVETPCVPPSIEVPKAMPKNDKIEIPAELNDDPVEIINGIKIVRDSKTGEIIKLDEYVLTSHERVLLKVNLTTPEKILSGRKTMKEADETIAHGWE